MGNPARNTPNVIYLDRPQRAKAEPSGTEWEDAALEVIATSAWRDSKARRLIAIALAVSLLVHAVIFMAGFKYLTHHVMHHLFEPPKPLDVMLTPPLPRPVEPVPPAPRPKELLAHKPEPAAKPANPAPVLTAPTRTSEPQAVVSSPPEKKSVTAAPQAAPVAEPQTTTAPEHAAAYLNNPPPAYPLSARRLGQQGLVLVRAYVNRSGRPEQVTLAKTSGVASLDEAALNAVRQWTFIPAKRGAESVDAWVEVPVRFRLNHGE